MIMKYVHSDDVDTLHLDVLRERGLQVPAEQESTYFRVVELGSRPAAAPSDVWP